MYLQNVYTLWRDLQFQIIYNKMKLLFVIIAACTFKIQ